LRNVLERASARETAMRVCLGAICAQLLEALGIRTQSYVARIGGVEAPELDEWDQTDVEASDVRCPHRATAELMIAAIDAAKAAGDTLGGKFVVRIDGVPVGVGSNRQPNQRLDGILAGAVMGMQTVRAVEIGLGAEVAATPGSAAHDVFALDGESVVRTSNRAGGIEGGMSNGEPIVMRVAVKPIPTLMKALPSVNLHEGTGAPAAIVRSDVCVVPAAAIVAESMVRLALAGPVMEKYGGDSMEETLDNLQRSRAAASRLFAREGAPRRP
jgi:chorismate synthase